MQSKWTGMGRASMWALGMTLVCSAAQADAVASLRAFVKDVQTGRGEFTQTVTSPDGKKSRKSKGSLEFQRPNRFRFAYTTPTEQLIVGDGKQVWLHDVDLNQVTERLAATVQETMQPVHVSLWLAPSRNRARSPERRHLRREPL